MSHDSLQPVPPSAPFVHFSMSHKRGTAGRARLTKRTFSNGTSQASSRTSMPQASPRA
jgi:hypothetical protein